MVRNKLVVAYCRVSTLEQKQNGYGIEIQIRDVTVFAKGKGLLIRRFYRDEGESGVLEERPELQRLLRHCKYGRIDAVIIPSLDRLSRDVRLTENLFWRFDQMSVAVLIADMPNYDGRDRKDVLIRQIREAIAEENRKDIIERLMKGRQERTRRGELAGGNLPYGYRRNGHGPEIDQDEAAVVRNIFRLAETASAAEIARLINADGHFQRNGRPWTARQVSAVLSRRDLYGEGVVRYGSVKGSNEQLILL